MRKRIERRNRFLRGLALVCLVLVAICFLPALIAMGNMGGAVAVAALLPFGLRRCEEADGAGGGSTGTLTEEQFRTKVLGGVEAQRTESKAHGTDIDALKKTANEHATTINELRKQRLSSTLRSFTQRQPRVVSDECALELASQFIIHCERSGKMEALAQNTSQRDSLLDTARNALGISVKTALSTSDIPLPSVFSSEMKALISEFGVARKHMSAYPIGMGTARPARWGTRPAFGSIAMSGSITERSPTLTFASLESHKIGGLVRLPREIDEQSIVPMGQFLARYGAVEFARAEDTWAFLADGTGTFESVVGICSVASTNSKIVTLGSTKTKPSDATLADFRSLRTKVNKAALSGRVSAYYLDTTWETALPAFRTAAEPNIYQRLPDGSAILDGYPIVWTDVMYPYSTTAAAGASIAVFGALQFWWMGEHGSPRIDTSEDVFFANDQLAVRFIEEIDFDYAAVDAAAVMYTAAA